MYKTGTILIVTAVAPAASGAPGLTDGAITLAADNGAVVTPTPNVDNSWSVTLANPGDTNIVASAAAGGKAINGSVKETAADLATQINLTVSVADAAPAAS